MSDHPLHIDQSFAFQCFHTDWSGDWECQYFPEDSEEEQITLTEGSSGSIFRMSVETARAIAHTLLAAVQKHDSDKRFQEVIAQIKER